MWPTIGEVPVSEEWRNGELDEPGVFAYGFIPPALFAQIKAKFLELAREQKSGAVRR
jgi:hypothetical protein